MWDERYDEPEYAYGVKPNDFLLANHKVLPQGKVLSLAEGEGRNAVFLAKQGFQVTAIDSSIVGINKAKKLAEENDVKVDFLHIDICDFNFEENYWDAIVSIFCPLPSMLRRDVYLRLQRSLKKGGVFLLEAYTPKQVQFDTGGGKDRDLMQSSQTLNQELTALKFSHLSELQRSVVEGKYHTGLASVVQAVGSRV